MIRTLPETPDLETTRDYLRLKDERLRGIATVSKFTLLPQAQQDLRETRSRFPDELNPEMTEKAAAALPQEELVWLIIDLEFPDAARACQALRRARLATSRPRAVDISNS